MVSTLRFQKKKKKKKIDCIKSEKEKQDFPNEKKKKKKWLRLCIHFLNLSFPCVSLQSLGCKESIQKKWEVGKKIFSKLKIKKSG